MCQNHIYTQTSSLRIVRKWGTPSHILSLHACNRHMIYVAVLLDLWLFGGSITHGDSEMLLRDFIKKVLETEKIE